MTETTRWRVDDVRQELDEPASVVLDRACEALGVSRDEAELVEVFKRSIDARGRRAPRFVHQVDVVLPSGRVQEAPTVQIRAVPSPENVAPPVVPPGSARPVVIGLGPCGLFAALHLALAGIPPIVIDRGKPVETRAKDVSRLLGKGEIHPDSNLCFGEGGAGTWSDGKLYTRVGGPFLRPVLEKIVDLGGPERILTDGRPHLGTDRLIAILKAFRAHLVDLGCVLRFETAVDHLATENGRVTGVVLRDGERVDATHVVLAPGHSARALYRRLAEDGVPMAPKPFSVGFRIEHPQALINEIQYGRWTGHEALPAAYYELKTRVGPGQAARGVYSFCMCPGGSVVPTPTHEGEVCVNGMSHAARSGRYANSAVVVEVQPEDVLPWSLSDAPIDRLLSGVAFQEAAERRAWELGGGAFVAPAQQLTEFLQGDAASEPRRTTYKRGVNAAPLSACYPEWVTAALREGVRNFDQRFHGYLTDEAVLIGVETRTSAPVSIPRDRESLQSVGVAGLYPAGEGSGYGGGIASAAIDGIRVAHAIAADVLSGGS